MSAAPIDSPNAIDGSGNTQPLARVDSFAVIIYYFSGSSLTLCYRLIDIALLSLGLYYGTGACKSSNSLAVISICLLIFNGIDLAFFLLFLIRKFTLRNVALSDEDRLRQFRATVGIHCCFLFIKFIINCIGTVYVFKRASSINPDCELIRFCLGIVCYSTLIKISMPTLKLVLPTRRASKTEYFITFLSLVFNGIYFGVVLFAAVKTKESVCMYINIEDLYFRAPLKSFAYIGLIPAIFWVIIQVLRIPIRRLFFDLPTRRKVVVCLFGIHYTLYYLSIVAYVYYFSIGAVLLFQPRSGGSCRSVAPSLYKTLLIWQWLYTLWPFAVLSFAYLLMCCGVFCGSFFACCLPASVSVPVLEATQVHRVTKISNSIIFFFVI